MLAPLLPSIAAAPSLSFALPIERLEITAFDGYFFARVWSGGLCGVAALNGWTPALVSLWQTIVFPFWIGRDTRDVAAAIEAIGQANYQLASAPFWMAVAGVELAIWDLLGHAAQKSVAELLCDKPRRKVPVYLSSSRRDSDAAAEVEWLGEAIDRTGARAAKIQIGGGLSWDAQTEARDRALLGLARQNWGEKFVIYAAADGSFEAKKAVEIGALLHEHKIAWFEEPCHYEDFEATRAVAANVQLPVAGGARDSSFAKWKWLLENCALDVARPDLGCNGGLWRCWQVAHFAASLNVSTAPHSPASGPLALAALQLAAALEKPAPFLEWDARLSASPSWFATPLEIRKGAATVPTGAGWGALYDDEIWSKAEILVALSV